MTWNKYKTIITVAGTISLTGGLWWLRDGGALRGVDHAEIAGAVIERRDIPKEGFNGTWSTNQYYVIGNVISKAQFKKWQTDTLATVIDGIMADTGAGVHSFYIGNFGSSNVIEIAAAEVNPKSTVLSGDTYWQIYPSTNHTSAIMASCDRVFDATKHDYNSAIYPDQRLAVSKLYGAGLSLSNTVINNWWEYCGFTNTLYSFTYPGWAITTNELNEMRQLLTNMVTTACFMPPSLIKSTSDKRYWYGNTGEITGVTYTLDGDPSYYTTTKAADEMNLIGKSFDYVEDVTFDGDSYLSTVQNVATIRSVNHLANYGSGYEPVDVKSVLFILTRQSRRVIRGCKFDYPSTNAFTGSLIKRYRVYAICTTSTGARHNKAFEGDDWQIITHGDMQPGHYENRLLGTIEKVAQYPIFTVPSTKFQYLDDNAIPAKYYAVLMVDKVDPSTRPVFDIGTSSAIPDLSVSDYDYSACDYDVLSGGDWQREKREYMDFSANITIRYLMVVIDWNFEYI